MSLGLANEIARGSLAANSIASFVVSRNIANVNNPYASRKTANVTSLANHGVAVDGIANAIDSALFERVVGSSAKVGELSSLASALATLSTAVGDPESEVSLNSALVHLKTALQTAASAPQDDNLARGVLSSAQTAADRLNSASEIVNSVRINANSELTTGVGRLTNLLASFETINNEVVAGTVLSRDVTDQSDQRNDLLKQISQLVDVHAFVRGAQDMVIFAANGTTLFETVPRTVSLDSSLPLVAGQGGGALRIDGIPFSGGQGSKLGGTLGGALQVRDVIASDFGRQLDEVARGLIETFAEADQSTGGAAPLLAGLFTYSEGPAVPGTGTVVAGIASSITVNPSADPAQGGSLARLRDGGIASPGNPSYIYNSSGHAGFSDRLRQLVAGFEVARAFDTSAQLGTDKSLIQLSAESAGWLEGKRAAAQDDLQQKQIQSDRASTAWQSAVGINLDEELTTLMSLEKSFQASSRLITTVDSMFDALLQMAR